VRGLAWGKNQLRIVKYRVKRERETFSFRVRNVGQKRGTKTGARVISVEKKKRRNSQIFHPSIKGGGGEKKEGGGGFKRGEWSRRVWEKGDFLQHGQGPFLLRKGRPREGGGRLPQSPRSSHEDKDGLTIIGSMQREGPSKKRHSIRHRADKKREGHMLWMLALEKEKNGGNQRSERGSLQSASDLTGEEEACFYEGGE